LINRNFRVEIGTTLSARSVGYQRAEDLMQVSSKDCDDETMLKHLFGDKYHEQTRNIYHTYGRKLHRLQQIVFEECKAVKFIDMLPYDQQFITYITSYFPIVHPNGEVVAILSSSIKSYVLRFQGHIGKPNLHNKRKLLWSEFSIREQEILFLITNGATQEQISQILNISRSTVSMIIGNQICPKFNIPGANTKILLNEAINAGFYRHMPQSLWKPCLIVLNEDLLDDSMFKESPED
jgi:DNA-binding CsgD family transcriptional regulator